MFISAFLLRWLNAYVYQARLHSLSKKDDKINDFTTFLLLNIRRHMTY